MKLRTFAALATLGGGVLFAGWGAIGVVARNGGDVDAVGPTVPSIPVAAASVIEISLPEPKDVPVAPLAGHASVYDRLLLSPQITMPARPRPEPATPAPVTEPSEPDPVQKPEPAARHEPPATAPVRAAPVKDVKKPPEVRRVEDGGLTVASIAHVKAALRLSPDQQQHWQPVEAELREIAREFAAQKAAGRGSKLDLSADRAQRLYWAAGPFLMSLREDQKREARRFARAMGLEMVASLI